LHQDKESQVPELPKVIFLRFFPLVFSFCKLFTLSRVKRRKKFITIFM